MNLSLLLFLVLNFLNKTGGSIMCSRYGSLPIQRKKKEVCILFRMVKERKWKKVFGDQ